MRRTTHNTLAAIVTTRREELGLSMRGLARRTEASEQGGISVSYVSKIEKGEYGNLTTAALRALAVGLSLPFETLARSARGLTPGDRALGLDDLPADVRREIDLFLEMSPQQQRRAVSMLRAIRETVTEPGRAG